MRIRNLIANHMKIKLAIALGAGFCAACPASLWSNEPLRIVTSFYPVYVAALNVTAGVPGVEVSNLASPHIGCLHDYQLTAGDVRRLADADILLVNGAGMEPFLGKVAQQSPKVRVVAVSEGIPLLEGNPHVWVSLEGARRQTDNIAAALAAADPDQADAFRANAAAYNASLSALEEKMRVALAPYAGTPIVTFHEAFPYFARDFGLDLAGVIEREPGAEPSARELADTVKLVRARQVKALFAEPQFPDQSAQVVARETGVRVYSLDPVVTGPSDPVAARGAYLQAMEKNLEVLQEALR
jgi:zinc transport system substrate-binding protein